MFLAFGYLVSPKLVTLQLAKQLDHCCQLWSEYWNTRENV